MAVRVIRKVRLGHCKRGPDRCDLCRQLDVEEFCLLELFRPGESLGQRRLVQAEIGEEGGWWEFEVVRRFQSEEEARLYGQQEGVEVSD